MVQSPDRGLGPAECQSYVHVGLQCDKKGNGMLVPSQTQGVVQRPIAPHTFGLHVLHAVAPEIYPPLMHSTAYINGYVLHMVSPRNLCPDPSEAAHTYIFEIPFVA